MPTDQPLAGKRFLTFVGDIYEDLELWYPKLRRDRDVLQLIRDFDEAGKLIAAICHGGWIPISAGVYRGVRVTGSAGIKDDLINAGGVWEDASVVIDRHFVSSRKPDDLPDFCRGILQVTASKKSSR